MSKATLRLLSRLLLAGLLSAVVVSAFALEEGIVKNADGDYVINYLSASGQMMQGLWIPSTKIDPTVRSHVRPSGKSGSLFYSYVITNGKRSVQDLDLARITVSNLNANSQVTPTGWYGVSAAETGNITGFMVGWSFDAGGGLKPDATQTGFGLESNDLPGVGVMEMSGYVPVLPLKPVFPDAGPSESDPIYQQFNELQLNDFVSRNCVVPRISVPSPFDAAAVLAGLQKHLDTDLVTMKLVDPSFASELDRWLQAAIAAAGSGNLPAVRSDLDAAYALLEREHKGLDLGDTEGQDSTGADRGRSGLIDRLAAQVLAFDIRYVKHKLVPDADKGSGQADH